MAGFVRALKWPTRAILMAPGMRHWMYRFHEYRLSRTHADWPKAGPDGLPLPGPYLMQTVVGHTDWHKFLQGGEETASIISGAIARNGGGFAGAQRILDLGCGCGRLIRFLPRLTEAELHGVDYNKRLLKWCRSNLPGEFQRNGLLPPLRYRDAHFDITYLLSVFTHLRRESQTLWIAELARITKPGGFVFITFHDEDYVELIDEPIDREMLLRDGFIVHNDFSEGSNAMASFQTRAVMDDVCQTHFEVCEIIGTGESELNQAYAVLRRT
ncbi:MAG: class I SAM-dependent methyltransferase [Pseudomonadota bacterium]